MKKFIASTLFVLIAMLSGVARANSWYVGPTGGPSNSGSLASPWDLQTALNQPSGVLPGDTIWMLNGNYGTGTTAYTSALTGTSGSPINVKQYPGARATINGWLTVNGSYSQFWDFEVTNAMTITTRISSTVNAPAGMTDGIDDYGNYNYFIDLVVHDTQQGIGFWSGGAGGEIYGTLDYNNGWQGTDRGHGHGIYTQNVTGTKYILNNILFNGFGEGIQCYGSGAATVDNYLFQYNTIFNSGSLQMGDSQYNLLVAGGTSGPQNISVLNNYLYDGSDTGLSSLSWQFDSPGGPSGLDAENNYFIGGNPAIDVNNWASATFKNNTVFTTAPGYYNLTTQGLTYAGMSWNNNNYFDTVGYFGQLNQSNITFANWQSTSGLDGASNYSTAAPSSNQVFVTPNAFEAGRGNITIYNWTLASSVAVNLSSVLTSGQAYVIKDAQNFYGPSVVSGTYSGGTVSIPMSSSAAVAPVVGTIPNQQPKTTQPLLGTFVVMASSPPPGPAPNIYITQSGSPSGNCTSSVQTPAFFNNSANWGTGSGQIGPGTTVLICGTFTGTAGQQLLAFQGSGTSGNPITLLADTGLVLTAPYWSANGAIDTNGKSYLVINGNNLTGTIKNTANGTGLTYQQASNGINVTGSSNITVEGWTITQLYVDMMDMENAVVQGSDIEIQNGGSHYLITGNAVSDEYGCIVWIPQAGNSDMTITNNTVRRFNWGIVVPANSSTTGPLNISGNDIACEIAAECNFDYPPDTGQDHHNGIFIFPQSGITTAGVVLSNNYIHDINGNTTAYIFIDPSGGNTPNIEIYNNVFFTTTGQTGPGNGNITVGIGVTGAVVVNNTISGPGARGFGADTNATMENNIVTGGSSADIGFVVYIDAGSGSTGNVSAYNDFFNWLPSDGWACCFSSYTTLSAWQTGSAAGGAAAACSGGCDVTGSITTNPNLTSSLLLNSASPARGAGTNLTSLGIVGLDVGAPQFFGASYACGTGCLPRPGSGSWDIGAYPYSGGAPPPPQIKVITSGLPIGTTGTAYSTALSASGGTPPYSWVQSPSLTDGLSLSASGVLSGTPTASGNFNTTVTASATGATSGSATYVLQINPAAPTAKLFVSNCAWQTSLGYWTCRITPTNISKGSIIDITATSGSASYTGAITQPVTH